MFLKRLVYFSSLYRPHAAMSYVLCGQVVEPVI
jgi:hypothetical protein